MNIIPSLFEECDISVLPVRCSKCRELKAVSEFHTCYLNNPRARKCCKVCLREYQRSWHREKMLEQGKVAKPRIGVERQPAKRKKLTSEEAKAKEQRWKERDPEGFAAYRRSARHRRRARRKQASGKFTAQEWLELCERFGGMCAACGKVRKLAADHVVPLARGGSNDISNIQPLCKSCNSSKGAKTIDYRT